MYSLLQLFDKSVVDKKLKKSTLTSKLRKRQFALKKRIASSMTSGAPGSAGVAGPRYYHCLD
jgi:hypothetical protein